MKHNVLSFREKGVSLIELMVTLLIGLFLLIIILSVYMVGHKGSQQEAEVAQLQSNIRTIFRRVGADLEQAGYVDIFDRPTDEFLLATGSCLNLQANERLANKLLDFDNRNLNVSNIYSRGYDASIKDKKHRLSTIGYISCGTVLPVVGCDHEFTQNQPRVGEFSNCSSSGGDANGNQLQIAFQAVGMGADASLRTAADNNLDDTGIVTDNAAMDCTGTSIPDDASGIVMNRYFLNGDQLMCIGNGRNQSAAIANNVREFKVRYRVTSQSLISTDISDSTSGRVVTSYADASQLWNDDNDDNDLGWAKVVGVDLCVVVAGDPATGKVTGELATVQGMIPSCARGNNGEYVNITRPANDRHFYQRMTRSFTLPNAIYR